MYTYTTADVRRFGARVCSPHQLFSPIRRVLQICAHFPMESVPLPLAVPESALLQLASAHYQFAWVRPGQQYQTAWFRLPLCFGSGVEALPAAKPADRSPHGRPAAEAPWLAPSPTLWCVPDKEQEQEKHREPEPDSRPSPSEASEASLRFLPLQSQRRLLRAQARWAVHHEGLRG